MKTDLATVGVAVKEHSPLVFFAGWLIGLPWPQIAAMLAAIWTAWLMGEKAWGKWKAWKKRRAEREQRG